MTTRKPQHTPEPWTASEEDRLAALERVAKAAQAASRILKALRAVLSDLNSEGGDK